MIFKYNRLSSILSTVGGVSLLVILVILGTVYYVVSNKISLSIFDIIISIICVLILAYVITYYFPKKLIIKEFSDIEVNDKGIKIIQDNGVINIDYKSIKSLNFITCRVLGMFFLKDSKYPWGIEISYGINKVKIRTTYFKNFELLKSGIVKQLPKDKIFETEVIAPTGS